MKLDNENDRAILLDLIGKATISGSAVFVLADIIQRIQAAEIVEPSELTENQLPVAVQDSVTTALL